MRRDSWRSVPRMWRPPSAHHLVVLAGEGLHEVGEVLGVLLGLGLGVGLGLGLALGVAAQEDVGAAARHVGGDGDGALAPRLGHDLRLLLVVLGVEHHVRHAAPLEEGAHALALLDGDGAHEDGLALRVELLDLVHGRLELLLARSCRPGPAKSFRTMGRLGGMTTTSSL